MITLKDVRDYIITLNIAEEQHCYFGIMPDKHPQSIGTYPLKSGRVPHIAIGGMKNSSYYVKPLSFLVHWSESPSESEKVSMRLYEALKCTRENKINGHTIKFIQMNQPEPIMIGTDNKGIFEYVIECLFYMDVEYEQSEETEDGESEESDTSDSGVEDNESKESELQDSEQEQENSEVTEERTV